MVIGVVVSSVLCRDQFGNGLSLNVRRALVDCANLRIAVKLFHRHITRVPNTPRQLNAAGRDAFGRLRRM